MPDLAQYQDHFWAEWVLLNDLDDAGDLEDEDYDGDRLPPPAPPADETPSAELAALLTDWQDRHRRRDEIVAALEAGDTDVVRLVHPDVLADPARLAGVLELARRQVPTPEPPERPFQPPYLDPSHELADRHGMVSHGPQFVGEQVTPLERLHAAFAAKGRLLAQMAALEGMQGNIAAAMGPAWNARVREVESEIEYLGRLMNIDPGRLHALDLRFEARARRQLRAEEKARREQVTGPRRPARVTAGPMRWPADYLGRPVPPHGEQFHPREGWAVDGKDIRAAARRVAAGSAGARTGRPRSWRRRSVKRV